MKSLSARQTELTERREAAFVQLVVLTTYTDRGAETVDKIYYFADRSLLYDYGNTGTDQDFEPFLMRSDPVDAGMEHLPSQASGLAGSQLQKELRLTFRNGLLDDGTTRLAVDLRTHNLEFARVELAQLPIDRVMGEGGHDLRSLTGDEHVVWFRGELEQIESVTPEEISVRFVTELPQIPWYVHADSVNNDPLAFGRRGNIVYGNAVRVPCLTIKGGAKTTLTVRLVLTDTTVWVTTNVDFPTAGSAKIGSEEISWTGKSGTAGLTGVTRGSGGTVAKRHAVGEVVIHLFDNIIEAAHHEIHTFGNIYVLNPINAELVQVNQSLFTKITANTTLIPGETIATAKITAGSLKTLLDDLATQAAEGVGQQPVVTHKSGGPSITESPTVGSMQLRDGNTGSRISGVVFNVTFPAHGGTFTSQTIRVYWVPNTGNLDIKMGIGGTIIGQILSTDPEGWYGFNTTLSGDVISLDMGAGGTITMGQCERIYSLSESAPSGLAESPTEGNAALRDQNTGSRVSGVIFDMTFPSHSETFVSQKIRVYHVPIGDGVLDIKMGAGGTIIGTVLSGEPEGWYEFNTELSGNVISLDMGSGTSMTIGECERVYFTEAAGPSTANTIIDGDSGFGLQFFADIFGYKVPAADTNFKVAAGALIEHPADIRRHLVAILAGLGHGAVDSTTFDAVETDLGTNKHYAILNELGEDFASVNAALDAETRTQLVQEEGSSGAVYKLHAALSTYAWPAKSQTVTLWQGFSEEGRDARSISTRFRALYDVDRSIGLSEEGARAVLRVDVGQNDISATVPTSALTAAEQKFGRRDHPGMLWLTHANAATAEEVLGYQVTELKRVAPIYSIQGVPWVEGYAIERGDIIGVTPPWESAERKCRVLEYVKNWDSEMVDLRVVEVP